MKFGTDHPGVPRRRSWRLDERAIPIPLRTAFPKESGEFPTTSGGLKSTLTVLFVFNSPECLVKKGDEEKPWGSKDIVYMFNSPECLLKKGRRETVRLQRYCLHVQLTGMFVKNGTKRNREAPKIVYMFNSPECLVKKGDEEKPWGSKDIVYMFNSPECLVKKGDEEKPWGSKDCLHVQLTRMFVKKGTKRNREAPKIVYMFNSPECLLKKGRRETVRLQRLFTCSSHRNAW